MTFDKSILVLSGGGMKTFSQVGSLHALDILCGLSNIKIYAGTSAGCIILSMMVLGYKPIDIFRIMYNFNYESIKLFQISNLISHYGLDNGDLIKENLFKKFITDKQYSPYVTLKDIYESTGKKIIMCAVCVEDSKPIYISHENYPNMQLTTALRMTTSLPFIYSPVEYEGKHYIDGGCVDNFPIELFKDEIDKVIGINLYSVENCNVKIDNLESYMSALIKCFNFNQRQKISKYADKKGASIINIPTCDVGIFDLNVKKSLIQSAFLTGYNETILFFSEHTECVKNLMSFTPLPI